MGPISKYQPARLLNLAGCPTSRVKFITMDIAREFDSLTEGYTANMSRWVPYYRKMIESMIENLPERFSPEVILDLGCGNGNVTALLISKFPEARYILVDASADMLEEAQKRFAHLSNLAYRNAYFQECDLPNNSLNLVVAGLSLHHLRGEEKRILFKEVFQWLKNGGCISVSDLFVDKNEEPYHSEVVKGWKKEAFNLGTTPEEWTWIMDHYDKYDHPDSFERQIEWMHKAGFRKVEITWKRDAWGSVLARV